MSSEIKTQGLKNLYMQAGPQSISSSFVTIQTSLEIWTKLKLLKVFLPCFQSPRNNLYPEHRTYSAHPQEKGNQCMLTFITEDVVLLLSGSFGVCLHVIKTCYFKIYPLSTPLMSNNQPFPNMFSSVSYEVFWKRIWHFT